MQHEARWFHVEPTRRVVTQIENDLMRRTRASHHHTPAHCADDRAVQVPAQDAQNLGVLGEDVGERFPPRQTCGD